MDSGVRLGTADAEGDRVFKVPEVPRQMKGKEKGKDGFNDIAEVNRVSCVESKSEKGKKKPEEGPTINEVAIEKANKNVSIPYHLLARHIDDQIIKRATIEYLSRTKDPTNPSQFIDKTHPDFKEFYGFVYRGVGYALVGRADVIYAVHLES